MWNPKVELVKKAAEIAKEKHPNGYNKQQLIEASEEVYGGFAVNQSKPIKTMEDVNHMGNVMSEIDGHYPRGMSGCFIVGINGGCGLECPVFQEGECQSLEGSLDALYKSDDYSEEEKEKVINFYTDYDEFLETQRQDLKPNEQE